MPEQTQPDDQPTGSDPPLYRVEGDPCAGELLPRRARHGSRGVLLVDRPGARVWLLDADDDARVLRLRPDGARPLAGDPTDLDAPAGVDHVVRAAYGSEYDVIAAPWADGEQP